MNKRILTPLIGLAVIFLAAACSGKKEVAEENGEIHEHAAGSSEEWKEMDDFHMIMAESFHPYKDSANLAPAKQHAAELVASAQKWANAPLPEKFKGDDEIKFKLDQLQKDAASFEAQVKTDDDKAIGDSLTKLHDLFHDIMESWYGEH